VQIPCPFDRAGPPHEALAMKQRRYRRAEHEDSVPALIDYVSCDQCKLNMDRSKLIHWVRQQNGLDISRLGPIILPRDWWKEDWPLADFNIANQFYGGNTVNINDAFPSKYIAAADLSGRDVPVTINRVEFEEVGQEKERRPVLYFDGKEKGLVLNKTNSFTIGDIHGPEMDAWPGESITLFPTQTDFQGKQVACIRIRLAVAATSPASEAPMVERDEDIPF